jgi:hypothetical protein
MLVAAGPVPECCQGNGHGEAWLAANEIVRPPAWMLGALGQQRSNGLPMSGLVGVGGMWLGG